MAFEVKYLARLANRACHINAYLPYVTLKCGDCGRRLDELYASGDDKPRLMSSWYDRPGPRSNPPSHSITRRLVPPPDMSPDLSLPEGVRRVKFQNDLQMRSKAVYRCHRKCGAVYTVSHEQLALALLAQPRGTKRVSTYDLGLIPVSRQPCYRKGAI